MPSTVITITTINVPEFMDGLCRNIADNGHADASILVIGDMKTPAEAGPYCQEIGKKYHVPTEYLDVDQQKQALADHPALLDLFPVNTPDRVILGGMLSYLRGADRIIAVDDDNYATENDFVGAHSITGTVSDLKLLKNDAGWFNVHSALVEERNIPFYPRGFPWNQRTPGSSEKSFETRASKVIVNQGLVLGDPDIDAITRLFWPIRATGMSNDFDGQFGLYPGTWSPFNYQNTCLSREVIPLYYRPISTKRNGDIWTAYVYSRLAEHFGDVITFGQPLVEQIRNPHDLWDDLDLELINNRATDPLISVLRSVSLSADTYFTALGELLDESLKTLGDIGPVPEEEMRMLRGFFEEYQTWHRIVGEIVD